VAVRTETFDVTGIRCERCVNRLAVALRNQDGLESARANLMGEVTLSWNDDQTDRERLVSALAAAGFRQRSSSGTSL
jgi:copper chaperone CopZ